MEMAGGDIHSIFRGEDALPLGKLLINLRLICWEKSKSHVFSKHLKAD